MSKIPGSVQIKSQPLAHKILGLANKTSFAGTDFTLPTWNKTYPLFSVLLKYQHVQPVIGKCSLLVVLKLFCGNALIHHLPVITPLPKMHLIQYATKWTITCQQSEVNCGRFKWTLVWQPTNNIYISVYHCATGHFVHSLSIRWLTTNWKFVSSNWKQSSPQPSLQ